MDLETMRQYRQALAGVLADPSCITAARLALEWALTLADAAIAEAGAPTQIALPEPCGTCAGTGIADEYDWTTDHGWDCVPCDGTGRIASDKQTAFIAELSRQQ